MARVAMGSFLREAGCRQGASCPPTVARGLPASRGGAKRVEAEKENGMGSANRKGGKVGNRKAKIKMM